MAEGTKIAQNVPGKYYVTDACISCGVCGADAPDHFLHGDTYYYVGKQPSTADEVAACEAAMGNCPSEAIGNNG